MEGKPEKPLSNYLLMGILCLLCLIFLYALSTPVILKASKNAPLTHAASNTRQIFHLLVEFDSDHGEFPSDRTAAGDLSECKGAYSNDYLKQLIIGKYTNTEEIFYTYTEEKKPPNMPDNTISPKSEILTKGECGFAYIKNLSTSDKSATPILLSQMNGDGYKFDSKAYKGKCVVLFLDGSVRQLLVDEITGQAILNKNKKTTLFQSGSETVWGEQGLDTRNLVYANN